MKSYRQFCGLAKALDVLGERWTLLVVRELLLGPRRYTDLMAALPGITTNLLAARLARLAELDVADKDDLGRWRLTASGAAIEPAVMELARWGGRFLATPRKGDRVDLSWGLLSMKRRYRGGLDLVVAVDIAGTWFTLGFSPDYLAVRKERPDRAAVSVHLSVDAARALFFGEAPLGRLLHGGAVSIDGERAVFERALAALLPPRYASLPRGTPPPELHSAD